MQRLIKWIGRLFQTEKVKVGQKYQYRYCKGKPTSEDILQITSVGVDNVLAANVYGHEERYKTRLLLKDYDLIG